MDRTPVTSSDIASIGYDEKMRVLEIEFRRGNCVFAYTDVEPSMAAQLMASASVGSFFHRFIKGHYDFVELKGDTNG